MSVRTGRRVPPVPAAWQSFADWAFFVLGGVSAVWLAAVLVRESFLFGWWQLLFLVGFWVALAYLVLPRLHSILTRIYVPDYFIGRARTSDGLLGDPVNLALLGSEAQLHTAMQGAAWIRADDLSFRTGFRIVKSTVLRRSYLAAPVSPLLLFGRRQDFAYQQEVDGSPGKRHHVRFWRAPAGWLLPGGISADWLAAGTYDRSVGFSLFTLQVTHKIAPDTDVERDHIVATVLAAQGDATVSVIRDFSTGYHARNGGGDAIVTDGDLPILDLRQLAAGTAEPDQGTDSRDRRPAPVVVGAVMTAVSALASILTGIVQLLDAPITAADTDPGLGPLATVVVQVAASAVIAVGVVMALLAWRVFLGSARARSAVMLLSVLSIAALVTASESGNPDDVRQNLWSVALTVLVLLALSSDRATTYVNRRRKAPKRISGLPGGTAPF
ncbi:LssY C-terminal domain-containing protein [Pseudarthrobacter sp. MEB009]|uniref:LssY C-terminal domain-containing protein n=1 Tax=Pseudarthrobacter sp. MEB009 TaxID=3040326 RepID=UPI0025521B18|nr:LssY C-terminal domain-containing protein [Pseudarthrobacter sp. MEB009]